METNKDNLLIKFFHQCLVENYVFFKWFNKHFLVYLGVFEYSLKKDFLLLLLFLMLFRIVPLGAGLI